MEVHIIIIIIIIIIATIYFFRTSTSFLSFFIGNDSFSTSPPVCGVVSSGSQNTSDDGAKIKLP